jgi:hypothetical protein
MTALGLFVDIVSKIQPQFKNGDIVKGKRLYTKQKYDTGYQTY